MIFFGKSKKTEKSFTKKKRLSIVVLGMLAIGAIFGMTACGSDTIEYSFNTSGGVAINNVSIEKGKEYELPIPVKEGYAFEGWYTNAEFTGEPVTSVIAEQNMTYYAKWTQLSVITLQLDGGTLAQSKLYLKAGENLYEFMKDYKPTKAGLVFGAWFDGTLELAQTASMPEDGITLTAKYKVAYTTEKYLQKLDLSGYEKVEDVVAYDYVGKAKTSTPEVKGFKEVVKGTEESTGATIASKNALSATASENLFRHYYDRESYTVTFDPNYPTAGGEKEAKTETLLYGKEISVPSDYEYEGYCLVGWATSATSTQAEYNAYYVDKALYNKDGESQREADKFMPERDTNLYAVWAKGYVDLFGGNDNVYLFGEDGIAYLSRGNVFFKGEYDAQLGEVSFGNLLGKLYENNTFSYYNDGKAFTLRNGQELDKSTTLILRDNTAEYTVNGEKSKGTFVKGEEVDCFEITYTSGALKGQMMTVKTRVMSVTDESGKTSKQAVFNVRNEEEAAIGGEAGGIFRVALEADGSVGAYYPFVSFDGFGVATLVTPSSESTYYYTIEDSKLTLSSTEGGSSALDARIFEINGITVYAEYKKVLDQTFTLDSGDTLKLDGGCKATYTVGGVAKEGYYVMNSVKSGALISVWAGAQEYKFLIEEHKEDKPIVGGEDGETETVTTYTIESKPVGYAEYRYVKDGSVYWAPLLVLDETVAGRATLYAQHAGSNEYVKISVGTYTLVDEYYVYTVDEWFDGEDLNVEPFDLATIKSIAFQVNTTATDYSLMYWKAYTTKDNVETTDVTDYTSTSGATLKIVGGFAFLKEANDDSFMGAYATKDGITTIINGSNNRYVELNEEDKTFVLLEYAPYKANTLTENDEVNSKEYVEFDGKGNATHVTVITAATKDTPAVTETKEGTVRDTGALTLTGEKIYEFKANDNSLSFKYINVPETTYIAQLSATYAGTYETAEEILKLDGYGYKAEFIDADGNKYTGLYTVTDTNEITFYVEEEEKIYYFDLKQSNTFTVRNEEYGSYLLVSNQKIEAYIDFDGYSKASVYTLKEENGEYVEDYIDANGTYTQNGSIFTIRYQNGNQQITLEAKLSTIAIDGKVYKTVTVICRDAVRVYVNENDWSVLILDEIGNAVKYNEEGVKEEGTYVLVTDDFLYYASNDLQDACVYEYDYAKGTATPVKFNNTSYYTADLQRLLFSEYGYAYFGDVRYYYHEDEKGDVLLYRQAKEGETPNKYGFVEDTTFGSFAGDQKVYDGKTYYKNSGFGITFDRVGTTYPVQISNNNATKYAINALTFTPGAGDEYIVMGSVLINNVAYDCYVIRELNEQNEKVMYVSIGYYRFYIDVTYNGGSDSSYTVTRLEYVRSLYSYSYLYTYFLNAMFFGTELEDKYGMVHLCADYNEQGEITRQYVVGEFLEGMSGLKDADGNVITFDEAEYSYDRGIYGATFTANDGNTYTLYFGLQYQSAMGRYGYTIAAFTRHQTLAVDSNDDSVTDYEVTVHRILFSELSTISAGDIYTIFLKKGTQDLKAEALLAVGDTIYYVVRERENQGDKVGKITSTKYYYIKLTEAEEDDSVAGGVTTEVRDYKSATVTEEDVTTYYMENGVVYVDVSATKGVTFIVMADAAYVVTESSYDEATKTYSGKLAGGGTFTVQMVEGGFVDVTINLSTAS